VVGGFRMIYLYDGSFYGLLTCVYEHYYVEQVAEIFDQKIFRGSVIDATRFIDSDAIKAEKVEVAIRDKFSMEGYLDMYRTFLSNDIHKDCYILDYIIHGFRLGTKMDRLYTENFVLKVRQLSRKVGFEAHRFKGLLRFVEKKPFLYANFEPDHDILVILAEHFADRFSNERIIIHDTKRKKAVVAYRSQWFVQEACTMESLEALMEIPLTNEESLLQQLWKGYFEHIGIEGRKNLKLQQQFVPLKYRKHILEFQ
jgi:probable DNA metabolism protein